MGGAWGEGGGVLGVTDGTHPDPEGVVMNCEIPLSWDKHIAAAVSGSTPTRLPPPSYQIESTPSCA